jgi:deoxyribonuclease-4
MSIAGGIEKAIERGADVGCETLQVFTKNNTQWKGKRITGKDAGSFSQARELYGISPIVAHDCYLINLAASNRQVYRKSVKAFAQEMKNTRMLGLPYLIFHPGAHTGLGVEAGLNQISESLNMLLEAEENSRPMLLLETTAGQGTSLGRSFEELAFIIAGVKRKEKVGVCYDTCHTFAAGYDIRTREACEQTFQEFDRIVGVEKLRVFHFNDAKRELGARIDRHEHIGRGKIGLEGFRYIINDNRFRGLPVILETPKENDKGKKMDPVNLKILRSLRGT